MSFYERNRSGGTTNHVEEIDQLRARAAELRTLRPNPRPPQDAVVVLEVCALETAAALLEVHDASGISLDDWVGPRQLIDFFIGPRFLENGV